LHQPSQKVEVSAQLGDEVQPPQSTGEEVQV